MAASELEGPHLPTQAVDIHEAEAMAMQQQEYEAGIAEAENCVEVRDIHVSEEQGGSPQRKAQMMFGKMLEWSWRVR